MYSTDRMELMPGIYELAVLGDPSDAQIGELMAHITRIIGLFGLRLGEEVG